MNREKRTYSGPLLEADFYPIFQNGKRIPSRTPKTNRTPDEQKRYNYIQAVKRLIRLVNTNFNNTDYFMHPTYKAEYAPQDEKTARRGITNYLRRVKYRRCSELKRLQKKLDKLPEGEAVEDYRRELKAKIKKLTEPCRYIYIIECTTYKQGEFSGRSNWHFHLFVSGGLDDRTMEKLWSNEFKVNANNYQPERFGPEAGAKYMMKSPEGMRRFVCSRNLKQPKIPDPSKRDGKTTQYQLSRWAEQRIDDAEFWERRYKGYKFIKCYAQKNGYNGRYYLSVIMYRSDAAPPEWSIKDWLDDE